MSQRSSVLRFTAALLVGGWFVMYGWSMLGIIQQRQLQIPVETPIESKITVFVSEPLLDVSLREYATLQRQMLDTNSDLPPRFLMWRCGSGPRAEGCAGFGDRVKSILNAFVLAFALDRALLLDSYLLFDFKDVYEVKEIDWRKETAYNNKRLSAQSSVYTNACFMKNDVACLLEILQISENTELIVHESNFDLAGDITHHPLFVEKFLAKGFLDGNWRGKIISKLLIPNKDVQTAIQTILQNGPFPDVSIHIRLGGSFMKNKEQRENGYQPADRPQTLMTFEDNADHYYLCLQKALKKNGLDPKNTRVFLTSDFPDMIESMKVAISPGVKQFLDGNSVGELGHISRFSPNFKRQKIHIRLAAEFEIFRNSRILLVGESGLSLIAYRTRARSDQIAYAGWKEECDWPWYIYWVYEGN